MTKQVGTLKSCLASEDDALCSPVSLSETTRQLKEVPDKHRLVDECFLILEVRLIGSTQAEICSICTVRNAEACVSMLLITGFRLRLFMFFSPSRLSVD